MASAEALLAPPRMSARTDGAHERIMHAEVAADIEAMYNAADEMEWHGETPGWPKRMIAAFLTASPWKWVLVAPYEGNPDGFVNLITGETHAVAWPAEAS